MTPREKIRSPDLEALTDGQLLQLLTGPRACILLYLGVKRYVLQHNTSDLSH